MESESGKSDKFIGAWNSVMRTMRSKKVSQKARLDVLAYIAAVQ